ncbi:MAG: hypothetical protein K2X46_03065, partial [Roseomonas sp.]|nr:hypothetical protein [Roseomonas sp.]
MTAAVEIILTLEPFTGPGSELWVGQGLRATMAVKDVATGAGVAATGVRMLVRQGGATVPTEYAVGQLTAAGTGRWVLDLVPEAGGPLWVRAECTGPRPGAREARARVRSSNVLEDTPPDVILATPEGEAIGTPDGAA